MYERTYWKDHVRTPDNTYNVKSNGDGTSTITPAGEVMQQGTPQDQTHFNNLEVGVSDAHAAIGLLINFARQNAWVVERGQVDLTNTGIYPFNTSAKTVALATVQDVTDYIVVAEAVTAAGNVGEIVTTDKLANGFKLGYTGSAKTATIKYTVIGGYLK